MERRWLQSLGDLSPDIWRGLESPDFSFTSHAFLRALETSGSVGEVSGWNPHYLTLWEGPRLVAALSLYGKDHSYGEYIFDWAWAEAYQRHGLAYYPKACASVPFTPATGAKLLLAEGSPVELKDELIRASLEFSEREGHSSLHFLFIPPEEIPHYRRLGFGIRHSHQYHWKNRGYGGFDDFLSQLKRERRQAIRSERRKAQALDLEIRLLQGPEIQAEHLEAMGRCYRNTCEKKSAIPYLKPSFFREMSEDLKAQCLLVLAREGKDWVAGAIFFHRGRNLYGRYWGALRDYPFLHFELCYYLPIEWAIANRIDTFEAGAQGEHKMLRGFSPTLTYSAHWIRHPGFREAIDRFLEEEKRQIALFLESLKSMSAYRDVNL